MDASELYEWVAFYNLKSSEYREKIEQKVEFERQENMSWEERLQMFKKIIGK